MLEFFWSDGARIRSAEFFGFFGFFGKVAAFIGPLLYGLMTVMFDSSRILSIAMLILIGAVMMRWVDVEEVAKTRWKKMPETVELMHKGFNGFRFALVIEQSLE